MKRQAVSLIGLVLLFACHSAAHAVSIAVQVLPPTQTTGSGLVSAGLIATGSTDFYSVSVAAGFTITCEYNSMPINAESGKSLTDCFRPPGPLTLTVVVPQPAPGSYDTANYNSIPPRECKICNFAWKGTATGESVGYSGHGVSVSFSTGADTQANTVTFQMCRPGGGGRGSGSCDP